MYCIQINWTAEDGWVTTAQEITTLEIAFDVLKKKSNLSRICAPLRIVDEEGVVHGRYHVECDWRLPGCLWRRTKERAHQLWEESGGSENNSERFWFEAERQLIEDKDLGIRVGDFTQEETDMYCRGLI